MAGTSLIPVSIETASPVFLAIQSWVFEDEFVARILADDIPQRAAFGLGRVWAYEDNEKNLVAFGTLDMCKDYADLTGDKYHMYIPLLAVHPEYRGRGYGRIVLEHLVNEAMCAVGTLPSDLHPAVILDVYEESSTAYALYRKCGFHDLCPGALVDPVNGKTYRIMARRVV